VKRSGPLPRHAPLQTRSSLSRSPMSRKPSGRRKRMTKLRRDAYEIVGERSGGRACEMCGRVTAEHEHSHRSHAGHGGAPSTLRASNLLLSCAPFGCNWRLSADADFAELGREKGWLIGRGDDPENTPVEIRGRSVLLRDNGEVIECPDGAANTAGAYRPLDERESA
jgi:hypothetical protein